MTKNPFSSRPRLPVKKSAMPRKRRAFTLVELLVVVGIITILIAILLPLLSNARQRADATKCASNIRQVVAAMAAYEADHSCQR
jgi:prepilin-type N-terminal cleavage/methylation domain-containing protein